MNTRSCPYNHRIESKGSRIRNLELDITALNEFLLSRGMRIANGYGPLKGKTFRIAHMGETQTGDIKRLLAAMDDYIGV